LNNIVDNVIRELEFKAGLTLASFGLQAELKAIQNYLNKESIDEDLKEACHIIFRTHFLREALRRDDAEDACYNLIMLWDHCSTARDQNYSDILVDSIEKLLKVTNKRTKTVKNRHLRVLELNKMNWSIDSIAADTGYSRRQISRVINGHTKN
jgi:AraC-like DNA-binding protein|tara:strand:+ start:896 stop:1354 length:459 start_codon:yes stop_codon:yes gene_type:complete